MNSTSWLGHFYRVLALVLIGGFAFTAVRGWEFRPINKRTLPASVRGKRDAYRSFHFWPVVLSHRRRGYSSYGGYSGGK